MRVYVVCGGYDYEGERLVAVFSTLRAAKRFVKPNVASLGGPQRTHFNDRPAKRWAGRRGEDSGYDTWAIYSVEVQ